MDEKRYYRNRASNQSEKKTQKPPQNTEKESRVSAFMFMQSVVCLTVLGLILLSKVAFKDGYNTVKEVFADSAAAQTEIGEVFSRGAEYIESAQVFSQLFETEEKEENEEVLIEKTSADNFTKVNGYIEEAPSSDAAVPVYGGVITSGYGLREDPFTGETANHQGVDIGVNIGSGVVACFEGKVEAVASDDVLGNYIVLTHENGLQTKYAHLLCPLVSVGQTVSAGQRIGLSGNSGLSTGPHLHFAVLKDGKPVNPLDYVEI